jgi:glyoxylase-like metal-dependent hydrolase (beta-lactamase superfamily II)
MFGVVPKSIWQRTNPADEHNLITLAMRCLLVESGNRLMLVDNGIGTKQDDKFLSHYHLHGNGSLHASLQKAGFSADDITDMFLSHLHFDHCGGSVARQNGKLATTFQQARYWSNADHWRWATQPNPREKASFLRENILPIQESGQLTFINPGDNFFPDTEIFYASGHTEKMMIPMIRYKGRTVCFMADLLPTVGHIPLPYVMGYDTRPLLTLEEKSRFLNTAADNQYVLFLEHDPDYECCTVKHTEKGVRLDVTFKLSDL